MLVSEAACKSMGTEMTLAVDEDEEVALHLMGKLVGKLLDEG